MNSGRLWLAYTPTLIDDPMARFDSPRLLADIGS